MGSTRVITLREYRTLELEAHELDMADAMLIFRGFGDKIEVEEPSMRTGGRWRLRPSGWAGWIPLRPGLRLHLEPKFPAVNIFRMLEYAYSLTSFKTLAGIAEAESIEEIYRRLATVLARRVIDRGRRGLYRSYVPDEDRLPYVRGAVDVARSIRDPWNVSLHCAYQEHTADIRENQLLAWTLHTIIHQGIVAGDDLELVMAAWRSLRGTVTLRGFRPAECVGWLYHRLNEDYRPLHALCRFFLERAGPEHRLGAHDAIPFLVDMAKLYESYVAGYLARAIGPGFRLNEQQEADVAEDGSVKVTIDLLLSDDETGIPLAVLDTKYKPAAQPSADDLQQVVAYAVAKNCRRTVLIYPSMPARPFNGRYGASDVEVMTTYVSPGGDVGNGLRELMGMDSIASVAVKD